MMKLLILVCLLGFSLSSEIIDCPNGEKGRKWQDIIQTDGDLETTTTESYGLLINEIFVEPINCFSVLKVNGSEDASIKLLSGGIGSYEIFLKLTSQLGKGFIYQATIWAELKNFTDINEFL